MKIGITSQNFRSITGHAGKTRRFLVLESHARGQVSEVERLDLPKEMSLHEFRGDTHPVFDLDVLITGSCGQGFVRRLAAYGVKVVATAETDPVKAATDYLSGHPLPPPASQDHDHSHGHGPQVHLKQPKASRE